MNTALAHRLRAADSRSGIGGLQQLADAFGELREQSYRRSVISAGLRDRYRIDDAEGQRLQRWTRIASDGRQRWRIYPDRGSVGQGSGLTLPRRSRQRPASRAGRWNLRSFLGGVLGPKPGRASKPD